MKVTIFPNSVETKVSKKGNEYSRQSMYFHLDPNLPPEKVIVFVDGDSAYASGEYTLDTEKSVAVRDNALTIQPVLIKGKAA